MPTAFGGLALADSVALDPHKWLFVPVEAGLVFVRDGEAMRSDVQPGAAVPANGRTTGVGGLPWFSEYGFQQTRGFRALKVWMTMKQLGLAGYRRRSRRTWRWRAISPTACERRPTSS